MKWFSRWTLQPPESISLRILLVLPFVIQIMVAVGLTGWLSVRNGQRAVNDVTGQLRSEVTARIQQQLQEYITRPETVNQLNANTVQVGFWDGQGQNWEPLLATFKQQMTLFPELSTLQFGSVAGDLISVKRLADGTIQGWVQLQNPPFLRQLQWDQAGELQAVPQTEARLIDVREQLWFQEAIAADRPTWGNIYTRIETQSLAHPLSQPIDGPDGAPIGVFSAELQLASLGNFLKILEISASGQAFIMERSGLLVASSTLDQPFLMTYGTTLRIKAINSSDRLLSETATHLQTRYPDLTTLDRPQQLEFFLDNERQFIQVTPLGDDQGLDWLIIVVVPEADFMERIHANTRTTLQLCALALICSIFLGLLTSRWITRPITRLITASQAIAAGKLDQTVRHGRITEIQLLAQAFNAMSSQLTESFTLLEQQVQRRTAKLAEAEAELRGIFAAMTELVFITDADGRYLKIPSTNPALLIQPAETMIGKTNHDLFPAEQADEFLNYIQTALTNTVSITTEYKVFMPQTQRELWFAATISAITDTTVLWVARDITQRKTLEQELYRSQQFLNTIVENIPLAIFVKDAKNDFRYVLWNPGAEKLYGSRANQTLGLNSYDLETPELAERFTTEDQAIIDSGETLIHEHEVIHHHYRDILRQRLIKLPLRDEHGEVRYILCIAEDITEREKAAETLRKNEAEFRHLIQNVSSTIIRWKPDGTLLFINRRGCEFFGYSEAEIIGQNIMGTIIAPQDQAGHDLREMLAEIVRNPNQNRVHENENIRSDGQRLWVTWANQPIYDEQGELVEILSVATDTTERRLAEESLRAEQHRSEQLLLNILPHTIAQRLKRSTGLVAEQFSEVTLLFADIVGFTHLSSTLSATELVDLLNRIFSLFDKLADWHHLEKIKTIGDAYMVVGGLPIFFEDHANAIADFALNLQEAISSFTYPDGQPINLRIGIHTGPVVAGVIGIRKFSYDLWGDTVNIASRMESQGMPGQIQLTATTYEKIADQFECEERGTITVRGRGEMKTYWLLGHKEAEAGD
ncbi:adenylate/guanylate cyclase domain-containing protein [Spirulina major CS-329]|uniref:adenylate/guanylate cyclase domain-containing protein n=1 Tax=Spirulina TaxID=1154 RepID=UPI00232CDFFE|nr:MULTISPECIES: adenylate/guanylate cyclase domain-containing protein [Spirulina]MDB9493700.1 adenylate/guanylate cyclase domain-containing protein [Spirulina subsalsa CS-330]MDB9505028.1 adenylate/guanylate cyclase domain-containing protein [Spirulina major CS-329]